MCERFSLFFFFFLSFRNQLCSFTENTTFYVPIFEVSDLSFFEVRLGEKKYITIFFHTRYKVPIFFSLKKEIVIEVGVSYFA